MEPTHEVSQKDIELITDILMELDILESIIADREVELPFDVGCKLSTIWDNAEVLRRRLKL